MRGKIVLSKHREANGSPAEIAAPPGARAGLSPAAALLLAAWLGLCAGYLDVALIVARKFWWDKEGWYRTARDFPWTVPLGHVVLIMAAALAVAAAGRRLSPRAGAWLLATLALWGALLRLPFHGAASLLLAVGVGRLFGDAVAAFGFGPRVRWARASLAALLGVLLLLFASTTGRQMLRESRAVAGLPAPGPGARNVLLVVLDTVRASHMSLYGYERATTPNLARWAKQGVGFTRALAPAPWTLPSHGSFFTGRWPSQIDAQWKHALDAPDPTLAEFLASRGYQTAGFAANTSYCNYESRLDRGFARFEDYALSPRSLLTRTVPGAWLLGHLLSVVDPCEKKWAVLQSRGAKEVNDGVLDWLGRRRRDRPFFAFLNYFDTHEPYIPPADREHRFGIRPANARDYRFLFDFLEMNKSKMTPRDYAMARDCYDDCLAYLDEQVGRLLDELQRRGDLEDTVVIVTADHGEAFGDHGTFCHAHTAYLEELGVPLFVLAPDAPAGRSIHAPVSLRDLPATVADLLGLANDAPFPGRSLAGYWRAPAGQPPEEPTSPAFSEQADASAFHPRPGGGRGQRDYRMSIVSPSGYQYIRNGAGDEQLYNLWNDPGTQANLIGTPEGDAAIGTLRGLLLRTITENPGSAKVEEAYLRTYREGLADLVRTGAAPRRVAAALMPSRPASSP